MIRFMKFFTHQQNYKGSVSTHDDEHAGSRNCDSHGNPLEKKPALSTNVRNLYGSTPQLRHVTSNLGKKNFSKSVLERVIDIFHTDPHLVNQLDFHEFDDSFEPGHIANDYVGPAMELVCNVFVINLNESAQSFLISSSISGCMKKVTRNY